MCYTAKYLVEKALKRARHYNVDEDIRRYEEALKDYEDWHAVSGFAHPKVIIYTNTKPYVPQIAQWGLIPHWTKNQQEADAIAKKTLNARYETLFDRPSFKESAKNKRCLIPVAGFYEYHHYKNKAYPFYIYPSEDDVMMLAGLWADWKTPYSDTLLKSFSIVTCKANSLLDKIHNRKGKQESRMPVILSDKNSEEWLHTNSKEAINSLIRPYPNHLLKAHTVKPLKGKNAVGNTAHASEVYVYEEFQSNPLLF